MKTYLLLLSVLLSCCFSCRNEDSQADHQSKPSSNAKAVTLENGQRWIANAETTQGINNMFLHIASMPEAPAVEDYHALKAKLNTEFETILQKCTMAGRAHTELHVYLMPLLEKIKNLDVRSLEEGRVAVGELKLYLEDYKKYFQ